MRTTAVLFGSLKSDKFKTIITLRRAQKIGDTGTYENFDFLYNQLTLNLFVILAVSIW